MTLNALRHTACLLSITLLCAGAALGCTAADSDAGEEPTSAVASPILNAYDVVDDAVDGVPLLTRSDNGLGCSGVLLTNNWILTAAHCAVENYPVNWPNDRVPMATKDLRIVLGREVRQQAAEIRIHPTLDAALVRVSNPFPMDGRGWGYLRTIDPQPQANLLGYYVRCVGYGSRHIGSNMGPLGYAYLQVEATSANEFVVNPNASDQAVWYGDSGGPCFRVNNGALVGIGERLVKDPGPNEIVGAEETAVFPLRAWIGDVYRATLPSLHQRSIVWRNSAGSTEVWRMDGGTRADQTFPLAVGNEWQVQGTGDFDGDGEGDILWRSNTGQLAIWFMSFGMIRAQAYPGYSNTAAPVGPEWVVKGVGDFDGNGRADILWRRSDGQVGIWYMNGATRVGEAYPGGSDIYGIWQIQGIGDFDGNLKSDIIWRSNTGQLAIWFGGNANTVSYPGAPGLEWQINAVADFDGNLKSDILWRANTGQLAIWYDANSALARYPGAPGLEWTILGAGDFDGNGLSDILWRANDGATAIWFDANPAHAAYPGSASGLSFQGTLRNSF